MKTIRTALLDEIYAHIQHNLGTQEQLGVDVETGQDMPMEYVSVKRDEGRIIVKVLIMQMLSGRTEAVQAHRELIITVEKS